MVDGDGVQERCLVEGGKPGMDDVDMLLDMLGAQCQTSIWHCLPAAPLSVGQFPVKY